MTKVARKALHDLRVAHERLEREEEIEGFRVIWVAAVAINRAIGHVLAKIDSKDSPRMAAAIRSQYESWKADRQKSRIFFEFIESERNTLLKEYEAGYLSGPIEVIVLGGTEVFELKENLFCPLGEGPYAGEDCRDVLAEAIAWWDSQLSTIEQNAT